MRPLLYAFGTTAAVAIGYFAIARLSLDLLTPDGVAVFWPAAGIASGTLIALGRAARMPVALGVMVATIAANLLGDRNLASSIFFALANAGEAVLIALLIERFQGPVFDLGELRQVLGLVGATAIATALSGIAGTAGFILFHSSSVWPAAIWLHWFAADGIGTLTVAPLIIGFGSLLRHPPPKSELAEVPLALGVVAAFCALLIYLPNQPWTLELSVASLLPTFIWIAARFRPAITAVAAFLFSSIIVWTTIFGLGIFGDPRLSVEGRVFAAQGAILSLTFGALVLASLFNERRRYDEALLEREARLEEALRTGGILAFRWDLAADKLQFSQNAVQLLGLAVPTELAAAEWLERVHPDDRRKVLACTNAANRHAHALTFRYLRPGHSTEIWFEQSSVMRFDKRGKPSHLHGLMTDVSERKRFEQRIVLAQKSAERANQAKTSFLSAASHDLRQPLQTLRFLQGTLEQHALGKDSQSLVADMGRSLDTMSTILTSLLDLNKLETGNIRLSIEDVQINGLFDALAADFSASVREKGLELRVVRSALAVRTDPRMLQEMLRNLLSNAVRYTDSGKILMGCRICGDRVRIEVYDTGIGMSEDQLPHIFDEYYQSAQGAERGGFGLGLAIVKRLGEILDHRIEVRSKQGSGTVFCIEVPRGRKAISLASARAEARSRPHFSGTVVVVEDEGSVRAAMSRLFGAVGIDGHIVPTAEDALALIRDKKVRPDIVVCDYNLRGSINGIECVEAMRSTAGLEFPAIVITGDTRSKTTEALAAKGITVLLKPFVADELLRSMGQATEAGRTN